MTHVIARDRVRGKVFVGGLGVLRVGQMWLTDTGSHANEPEYENAPEHDSSVEMLSCLRCFAYIPGNPPEGRKDCICPRCGYKFACCEG